MLITTINNMEGFADIRGPYYSSHFWLWILIATGALILAMLLLRWRLKNKSRDNKQTVVVIPPIKLAIDALSTLRHQALELSSEQFAVKVTSVVREYIENSLKLPATEQTSEEFLFSIKSDDRIPEAVRRPMPAFLEKMDLVKFARQELDGSNRNQFIDDAKLLVESIEHTNQPAEERETSK